METGEIDAQPEPSGRRPERSRARRAIERAERTAREAPTGWTWIGFAILIVAGAVVLAYETRATTFWADEWSWVLTRRSGGVGTFLDPHNQHLSLVPVAIYKVLFATAGLRHYAVYRGVLIAADLACASLVFLYARRCVGGFMALLAGAVIVLFGPGWQDILWPFQIGWLIAIACGVGALLALDRGDRLGDGLAAVLLTGSLASSGVGAAIAVGVAVEVLLRRRPRDLWIVLVPVALYGLWWIGYQDTNFNRHALLLLPRFVFDAAAGVLSAITGLANIDVLDDTGTYLTWGAPLLVVAVIALIWTMRRRGAWPRAWALIAILLSFWILTGLGRAYLLVGAFPLSATGDESRYLYVGAVFAVLLAAELARGWRPSPAVAALALLPSAVAVVSNLGPLRDGSRLLQSQASDTLANLGSLDISRPIVSPGYVSNGFVFGIVTAREWFAVQRDLGSPLHRPPDLARLPGDARQAADQQLTKIQQLALRPAGPSAVPSGSPPMIDAAVGAIAPARGSCLQFRPSVFTPSGSQNLIQITVPPGGLLLRAGSSQLAVAVRRFSSQYQPLGTLAASAVASFTPAQDLANQPWHLQIASGAAFAACTLA